MQRRREEEFAGAGEGRQARGGYTAGVPARTLSLLLAVAALCACAHVSSAKKVGRTRRPARPEIARRTAAAKGTRATRPSLRNPLRCNAVLWLHRC